MESGLDSAYSSDVIRVVARALLLVGLVAFSTSSVPQNIATGDQVLVNPARPKLQSLCKLSNMSMGSHKSVRIAAVAEPGTDMGVLSDPVCPSTQPVWFELALTSQRNRNKLHNQMENSGKAAVIVSGELYGPPEPDPKLPESIRKNYGPGGWGHLGAFPMKLVVFRIESVAPPGKPYKER